MKHKRIFSNVILIIICLTMLSGCWDNVEIEKKIFVSTIGIDPGSEISEDDGIKKLKITYGFPNISEFSPTKAVIKEDGTITSESVSMAKAFIDGDSHNSRNIYLGHTRLILINEEMFKYPDVMKEVTDYIRRNPDLNRKINVVITEGSAEGFMKNEYEIDRHIENYVSGIVDNAVSTSTVMKVSLNDFLSSLSDGRSFLAPVLSMDVENGEPRLEGMSVISDYEVRGHINADETINLAIMNGKIKGGIKNVEIEGHPYDYEVTGVKRDFNIYEEDGVNIDIHINVNGRLKEKYSYKEEGNEKQLAEEISRTLAEECRGLIYESQNEMKADFLGIYEDVKRLNPDIWEKHKGNWNESYTEFNINLNIDTNIDSMGISQ